MIDRFKEENFFLSNFYPIEIIIGNLKLKSVEHGYCALKTTDMAVREIILNAETAGEAKILGKPPEEGGIVILREGWDQGLKVMVMRSLVNAKFDIPEMTEKLLATGDQELIEGNWWGDTFWGVCNGRGKNMLGKILMAKRTSLQWQS